MKPFKDINVFEDLKSFYALDNILDVQYALDKSIQFLWEEFIDEM